MDSEAGCVELRKGSMVELREDDMNCEHCGCLLPDEYHPNCKQCGGWRKATRVKDENFHVSSSVAWIDLEHSADYGEGIHDDPLAPVVGETMATYWDRHCAAAVDNSLEAAWERIKEAVR